METIYTRQNGRASPCSIESPRKYFNQGIEILGHRVRLSSSEPAHTRRWHKHNLHTGALVPKWLSYKEVQMTGLAGGKPTCVLFSLGVIREVPNQAKTNWSRSLRGPQSDKLISIPLTRNEPVLSQAENDLVGSVYSENKWACLRLYPDFFFCSRGQWLQWFTKDWEINEDEDKIWWM